MPILMTNKTTTAARNGNCIPYAFIMHHSANIWQPGNINDASTAG